MLKGMGLICAAVFPDTHRPFHSVRAYAVAISVCEYLYTKKLLKEIVLLGDYADFYSVMSHQKDARVLESLVTEVESVNAGLDEFDKLFPLAKKIYLEGNHENRLERYLVAKAPELFGVTDWQHLFKIPQRKNWAVKLYVPDQAHNVLGTELVARHTPPGPTPKKVIENCLTSVIYGHNHKREYSEKVSLAGKTFVAGSPGWLGNKHSPVFRYVQSHWQWGLGLALVWADEATKQVERVEFIEIESSNYSCIVDGKRFRP